ncbi:hypothetical protein [Vibrio viridaestus]|uniref:Chalcone isomerase domain-containing protein n=1 Tax=Vibrio viridaestus TaxID=2487322 RepID=A0A3N9TE52_9VIBR|nr:hypothetical protein [Vibrio viridaestus]RQW61983.1 hypothetical protein EES38_16570 [Vibrio viridaestus]
MLVKKVGLSLFFFFSTSVGATSDWYQWSKVGQADFSVFIWDIYVSQLLSEEGTVNIQKPFAEQNIALVIQYKRDITATKLLEATEDQWHGLGYPDDEIKHWSKNLAQVYPDIEEGDSLSYVSRSGAASFYFKAVGANEWNKVSNDLSPEFTNAFLSIWLSDDTQYPQQRQKLLGENK